MLNRAVTVTNSVNIGAVTLKNRAKARSIGSSKYKNLKLKKKEEKRAGGPYIYRKRARAPPGAGVSTGAVTLGQFVFPRRYYTIRQSLTTSNITKLLVTKLVVRLFASIRREDI